MNKSLSEFYADEAKARNITTEKLRKVFCAVRCPKCLREEDENWNCPGWGLQKIIATAVPIENVDSCPVCRSLAKGTDGKIVCFATCDSKSPEPEAQLGKFATIGRRIGALVEKKNLAYGDAHAATGDILKIIYPDGVRPDQYADMLGTARVLDKLLRISRDKKAFAENPWEDVAGYGILGVERDSREEKA